MKTVNTKPRAQHKNIQWYWVVATQRGYEHTSELHGPFTLDEARSVLYARAASLPKDFCLSIREDDG